jgi:hypothetical protein
MLREDLEQWADDHGYWHGTCPEHGGFWTDSGDACPHCEPEEEEMEIETPEEIAEQIEEIFQDERITNAEAVIVAADLLRKWKAN